MIVYRITSTREQDTLNCATVFVDQFLMMQLKLCHNITIYLVGDLGAGKTTFMRGLLLACGCKQKVKSPTYSIVEPYQDVIVPIYHFDLYRINKPQELKFMDIRDYLYEPSICCFEWPSRGLGYIPEPDFTVTLNIMGLYARDISIEQLHSYNH